MSAPEPLSREERGRMIEGCKVSGCDGSCPLAQYESALQAVEAERDAERARAERYRAAIDKLAEVHRLLIAAVTPGSGSSLGPNDRDEYDALFSEWHAATRACIAALAADQSPEGEA